MAADHDMEYWNVNEERIREILEPYPVVSFDIFDTLVQRTTLTLEDMYQLMEMEGVVPRQFAVYRRKAERECTGICNISDIYDKIGQITGWKIDALEEYCRAELKMENEYYSLEENDPAVAMGNSKWEKGVSCLRHVLAVEGNY